MPDPTRARRQANALEHRLARHAERTQLAVGDRALDHARRDAELEERLDVGLHRLREAQISARSPASAISRTAAKSSSETRGNPPRCGRHRPRRAPTQSPACPPGSARHRPSAHRRAASCRRGRRRRAAAARGRGGSGRRSEPVAVDHRRATTIASSRTYSTGSGNSFAARSRPSSYSPCREQVEGRSVPATQLGQGRLATEVARLGEPRLLYGREAGLRELHREALGRGNRPARSSTYEGNSGASQNRGNAAGSVVTTTSRPCARRRRASANVCGRFKCCTTSCISARSKVASAHGSFQRCLGSLEAFRARLGEHRRRQVDAGAPRRTRQAQRPSAGHAADVDHALAGPHPGGLHDCLVEPIQTLGIVRTAQALVAGGHAIEVVAATSGAGHGMPLGRHFLMPARPRPGRRTASPRRFR